MGLFDEEKSDANPVEQDEDVKEWERISKQTRIIVIGSLILSFIVGFFIGEGVQSKFITRVATGMGATLGTILFAGIPAAIAAQFTTKWRFVWLGITVVLLLAQINSYFLVRR